MSEADWISSITARAPARGGVVLGVGDDAAVLAAGGHPVLCHDMVVEGVHFRRTTHDWADVGHKALAVNLSDLAAMGAHPTAALIGLGLPAGGLPPGGLESLYEAMDALAATCGASLIGGDLTRTAQVVVGVTAVGRVDDPRRLLTRAAGRAGDLLCVSGPLGAAAAGLWLLEHDRAPTSTPHGAALVRAQRRPTPRIEVGLALGGAGVRCAMDISDGLAVDAERLAAAAGVAAVIDLDRLPLADGVAGVAARADRDPHELAATGGEDYELLVALDRERLRALEGRGIALHPVGHLEAGRGLRLRRDGRPVRLDRLGWEIA